MASNLEIQVENLDHLGLVAGMIDEIGIVEQINQLVGEQAGEIVSPGHAVKAMILNGLGLVSSPLYLFSKFFEGKATEHLIGVGIKPEHLNDDRLGRVLDKLYLTGLEQIFTSIALEAAKKFSISTETIHLDSSSFHVHGEYESAMPQVTLLTSKNNPDDLTEKLINEVVVPQPISITYGYSRDHRPDLKQFILDLICSGDNDVPLFLRVADGDEADQATFGQILCNFKQQLNLDSLMVADSALYSASNLALMVNLKWLTRVPLTVKQAKLLVSQLTEQDFVLSQIKGYRWSLHKSNYAGIEQRWLVVESEARRKSDLKRLEKKLEKSETQASKQLRELCEQRFACQPDAYRAAKRLSGKLTYHNLVDIQIIELSTEHPKASSEAASELENISYQVQANLERDQKIIETETRSAGRFVLATNLLDVEELSNDEMLFKYKEQQSSERGFSFLKDPLFFTDSVFLKSAERVSALALLMGLCLLVYTLTQRQLRQTLKSTHSGIKNQLGKLTDNPTLRWIFQCFQSVHLLRVNQAMQISNLTDERLWILRFFPAFCRRYYLLV
jgi:transposase